MRTLMMRSVLKKRIRLGLALLIVPICILIGYRICSINAEAWVIPIEVHQKGNWVDFDGAFAGYDDEKTMGYSLKLESAEIMSPNDFVRKYAVDPVSGKVDLEKPDMQRLIVLNLQVANKGNREGYMSAINWCVTSSTDVLADYRPDYDVWAFAHPVMQNQPCFEIKSDTEFTVHIPFSWQCDPGLFESFDESSFRIPDLGAYELIVTNVPIRKQIAFTLNDILSLS